MTNDAIKYAADAHVELIPQPYDEIYKAVGFEGFAIIFYHLGGQHVYIPTLHNVLADCIKTQAIKDCSTRASTLESVARKYGISGRNLRRLLRNK